MKENISNSRRSFLKTAFTATVVTAVCPHIVLGELTPQFKKNKDHIMGEYRISLNDYPVLKEEWGQVKIRIPSYMTSGFVPRLLICRLPFAEFGQHFSCLEELCPHEGQIVENLHPELHLYRCSGHGSMFYADGKYHSGPAARDLTKHSVRFEEPTNEIFLDIPALITSAELVTDNIFYINPPVPNPVSGSCDIKYGVEKDSNVNISISSISGIDIQKIKNGFVKAGNYTERIDISGLAAGKYFVKLTVANISKTVPLIIVR